MKISDEIRQWCDICCDDYIDKDCCDELCKLADRIDRETVELPRDADLVPIHVGDTVWDCVSCMELIVNGMRLTDSWAVSTNHGLITRMSEVTHERPDSFERIADELDVIVESADFADDEQLADLANRIRKLAKTDDIDVAGLRKQDAREHEQRHIHGGCEHL